MRFLFDLDSPIMQIISRFCDIVILNIVFLITCIPIFTIGAANTIDRIIDVFPPAQQEQIRIQLADVLECVIAKALLPAIREKGLCATVYTQVSDVEDEINGLLTYDRKLCKLRSEVMFPVAEVLRKALEK